jgi:hypothetical protein
MTWRRRSRRSKRNISGSAACQSGLSLPPLGVRPGLKPHPDLLFFKALKQNLKIKTFVGTSANALKVQVWTALIALLLLKYLQLRSRFGWSLSNLVALLRMNLFTHRDLWAWLDEPFEGPPTVLTASQGVLALA